jgi:hypothetical protein
LSSRKRISETYYKKADEKYDENLHSDLNIGALKSYHSVKVSYDPASTSIHHSKSPIPKLTD